MDRLKTNDISLKTHLHVGSPVLTEMQIIAMLS